MQDDEDRKRCSDRNICKLIKVVTRPSGVPIPRPLSMACYNICQAESAYQNSFNLPWPPSLLSSTMSIRPPIESRCELCSMFVQVITSGLFACSGRLRISTPPVHLADLAKGLKLKIGNVGVTRMGIYLHMYTFGLRLPRVMWYLLLVASS